MASITKGSEETLSKSVDRILRSASSALDSVSLTFASDTIWNMSMTQGIGVTDIADRPARFIEGMRAIYDDERVRAVETKIVKAIQLEFGLSQTSQSLPEVVRSALMC